jgi:hypothetical protein
LQKGDLVPTRSFKFPEDYKIIGLSISQGDDLIQISRSTYDLLKCFGDVGGLLSCLQILGMIIVSWYSAINYTMQMVSHLFVTRNPFAKMKLIGNNFTNQQDRIITDFQERQKLNFNCMALLKILLRTRMRRRIERKIEKELDILKIIRHQREMAVMMLAMFTPS